MAQWLVYERFLWFHDPMCNGAFSWEHGANLKSQSVTSNQHMLFISTDVAVPGLNRDFAHSRMVLVPERTLYRMFEDTVMPVHQPIDVLRKENATRAKGRDLLLPRLMNGETVV